MNIYRKSMNRLLTSLLRVSLVVGMVLALTFSALEIAPAYAAGGPPYMYIANHSGNNVIQATLSGAWSATMTLGGLLNGPSSIALDVANNKMYVTNDSNFGAVSTVVRANLDGSSATVIISSGLNWPGGIALDVANNKMYIANAGNSTISRANLDGTGLTNLGNLNGTLNSPANMTLNVAAGKMYVANYSSGAVPNGTISQANLDGTGGVALTLSGLVGGPSDVKLDLTNNKMYVLNGGNNNHIIRANLNGTGASDLGTLGGVLAGPAGIGLDVPNGKMYIVDDNGNNRVYQANLDGTGVVNLGNPGSTLNNPYALELDLTVLVAPTVTTQAASAIAATSATGNGNITATGGANATARGVIYYLYTNTDKIIGDGGVTNVSESGSFGAGAFTAALTPLSVNTQYNARAYATNSGGTGYGARDAFWTLANVPSAPTVNNPTATNLDVAVNVNGNPASTEFCIYETSTAKYVQAGGALGASCVWQTAATWGTKTVTGLTSGTTYTFQFKARNGAAVETGYGATASGVTTAAAAINFDANGGSGTMAPQVSSVPAALNANAFTRASYTFAGWNTAANGTGTAYADGATYNFSDDIILYAQWTVMVAPGAGGGNGPGGVGITDGSSSLELWLKPGSGVYKDAGTILASPGETVQQWHDQSGKGNDVYQTNSTYQPIYQAGIPAFNGNPTIDFSGDFLDRQPNVMPNATSNGAVFLVAENDSLGGWDTGVGFDNATNDGDFPLFGTYNAQQHIWTPTNTHPGTLVIDTPYIFGWVWQTAVDLDLYTNGNGYDAPTILNSFGMNVVKIGGETSNGEYWDGPMAEVVIFSEGLNDTRRILVENYLSAKYAVALSANNVYDGDTAYDFDLDMAGIGRFGGNNHTQAHSAGIIVVNRTFLQDNGDWLTFGHRTASNSKVAIDLPTGGGWGADSRRWARHWYFDRTETTINGGTVDIIFDFSEGGMNGGQPPAGPASNYRLLRRGDAETQFTDVATATAIVGDQVQFLGVDVSLLGSNFTLGTLNDNTSPTAIGLSALRAESADRMSLLPIGLGALLLILAGGALVINRKQRRSRA